MRDIPRGKGYDKASITRHAKALEDYFPGSVNSYARKNKLNADFLWRSLYKYFPDRDYVVLTNNCEYCKRMFARSTEKQRFCCSKCASDQKRDREYFAGNRRKTVGLADRICQICGAFTKKGIASHHVYGKVSDPKGKHLIALCPGCHDLITKLGIRTAVNDPDFWEKLIYYSKLRKNGESKDSRTKPSNKALGR